MEPVITIRPATTPEDLAALRHIFRLYADYLLHHLGFQHICMPTYEAEIASLPGRYAAPDGHLLIALVNDAPAGCIAVQRLPALHHLAPDTSVAELKRLFVLPEFRGHALGSQLAAAAIAFARTRSYDAIYLDTVSSRMPHAGAVYAAAGFLPSPNYNGNCDEGVCHFRLALR